MEVKRFFVAVLIVTFNPDERLFLSLENVQKVTDKIVIVDNDSSDKSFIEYIRSNFFKDRPTILEQKTNLGIAGALNHGVQYLKENFKVDYVLTLDQDTILLEDDLNKIITEANQRFDKIGIIALGERNTISVGYKEIKYVITSGNIVLMEIFNSLKFREEFFMDQVDFDFDYEVIKLGYRIVLADGYFIDHKLGIKWGKLTYEPLPRMYYVIRNSTVLFCEKKLPFMNYIYQILYLSVSSIFRDGVVKYSITLITGLKDGFNRRLGKNEAQHY